MRIFITFLHPILILFVSFGSFAQKNIVEKYDNGIKKAEGALNAAGYKTGIWKYYYTDGNLAASGSYNGIKSQSTIEVIKKSKNTAIEDKNSTRVGKWTFYYNNGQKKAIASYNKGCPTGTVSKWYKTGQKLEETIYEDCAPTGGTTRWATSGYKKFELLNEDNGNSTEIEWYSNGQMKSQTPYKDGQQYGRAKRWYENGQKEEDAMMKNSRVHGSYRSWFENGTKHREFFSINNVMSGEYREWAEDGTLIWEILELTREKKISVKQYWPNGNLKMSGKSDMPSTLSINQWSQTKVGYWTYWYEDKTVQKSEKYNNGQLLTTEMP